MYHKLRKRLSSVLLKVTLHLCTAHGLLPYKYNVDKGNFETSRWIKCYSLLFNVLLMICLCMTIPNEMHSAAGRFVAEKPLVGTLYAVHKALSIVTLFGTLLSNWTRRHELLRLLNDYEQLRSDYFRQRRTLSNERSYFHNYLILRSLMTCLQIASGLYARLGINANPSGEYLAFVLLSTVTKNISLFSCSNFFIGLLSVCQCLKMLNADLLELVQRQRRRARRKPHIADGGDDNFSLELELKRSIYCRLCTLTKRIVSLYQWQVLLVICSLCFGNIMAAFFFLIFLSGKIVPFDRFTITVFPQVFLINIADFYLYMTVCEHILNAFDTSLRTLRRLNETKHLCLNSAKVVETFALHCCCFKLRLRLVSIFDMNHKTGFQVLVATVLYLVVLVQFDYNNF